MSIASRITAMEGHLTDDYGVLTLAGADLTNVNKNILNLKQTWQERLLYFMNNGTQQVWNNWTKVSGSGTTPSINGTVNAPIEITYKGNTLQNGTPTPSSPIEIQNVNGNNTLNVCGKNLLDLSILEQGIYNNDANPTIGTTTDARYRAFKLHLPSGTYTFNTNKALFVARAFTNYDYSSYLALGLPQTLSGSSSFTLTQNAIVYISFRKYDGTNWNDSEDIVWLTKGNSATTYEPYQSQTYPINLPEGMEMCKIGTYQDYIYKENDKWYLYKEIGKTTLDGSVNWTENQEKTYVKQYLMSGRDLDDNIATGTYFIISNYFKFKYGNPTDETNEDYMWVYQKRVVLDIRKTIVADRNALKTWLGENKPIFYYQLATPTTTEITNTTLIAQLEASKQSYDTQTNISQTNNDLPFELSITALGELNG